MSRDITKNVLQSAVKVSGNYTMYAAGNCVEMSESTTTFLLCSSHT